MSAGTQLAASGLDFVSAAAHPANDFFACFGFSVERSILDELGNRVGGVVAMDVRPGLSGVRLLESPKP
jgi:hypothetical protein